jgi:1-aminocyclopropane-1-carboxylate deaminase/D-cysteine desulfhydrase-like pyridoxal-dependent ACC family enzyme
VHRLPRLGAACGTESLYIKRDDLTTLGLGGNKVRSLEYLLGDALAQHADTIIAAGGLQSNLCRLTAAAAAKLGLRCILVHNAQQPDFLQGNMLLNHLTGAQAHFLGPVDEPERESVCDEIASEVRASGRRPYVVRNGASVPWGALGYVNAALELFRQNDLCGLGIRQTVIVGAMGGTASGLVLGLALLGAPMRATVVSVEYPAPELRSRIEALTEGALALLRGTLGAGEDDLNPVPLDEVMTINDDYLGDGYARETAASRAALLAAARLEGIFIEPVYTSKTLAGCMDLLCRGELDPDLPTCYWHTGGAAALFGLAHQLQPQPS